MWNQLLGRETPLRKGMATYSSVLAWRNPWTEEPGWLQSKVSQSQTRLKQLNMQALIGSTDFSIYSPYLLYFFPFAFTSRMLFHVILNLILTLRSEWGYHRIRETN